MLEIIEQNLYLLGKIHFSDRFVRVHDSWMKIGWSWTLFLKFSKH